MHLSTLLTKHKSILSIFAFLSVGLLFSFTTSKAPMANALDGGWSQVVSSEDGDVTHVLLLSGAYFSWTAFKTKDGAFLKTKGGSWKTDGKKMTILYEFNTADSTLVGSSESWKVRQKGGSLRLKGVELKGAWKSMDQGVDSPLSSPWLFSGRKRNGEITRVDMTTRPRKTMKILTGNRFQWIAYNTETGQFHGTGGGSYTAENGVYTENIEFFSRDNKRVGAKLQFEFEVKDGDWHHSGKSSSGNPMYEIWSKRK